MSILPLLLAVTVFTPLPDSGLNYTNMVVRGTATVGTTVTLGSDVRTVAASPFNFTFDDLRRGTVYPVVASDGKGAIGYTAAESTQPWFSFGGIDTRSGGITNRLSTPMVSSSCITAVRFSIPLSSPAAVLPPVPSGKLFAMTVVDAGDGMATIAVLKNGAWVTNPDFRSALGTVVKLEVDLDDDEFAPRIVYSVDGLLIAACDVDSAKVTDLKNLAFTGYGTVESTMAKTFDDALFSAEFSAEGAPGTNFTAIAANGKVRLVAKHESDILKGVAYIKVKDRSGNVVKTVEKEFDYDTGPAKPFEVEVDGLKGGQEYIIEIDVAAGGESVAAGEAGSVITAKDITGTRKWIYEDYNSYRKYSNSTGAWTVPTGSVLQPISTSDGLRFDTDIQNKLGNIYFVASNVVENSEKSTIRDIAFTMMVNDLGAWEIEDLPEPSNQHFFGITILADREGATTGRFAVLSNGLWHVTSCQALAKSRCTVGVRVNYGRPGQNDVQTLTYYLMKGGNREPIAYIERVKDRNGRDLDYTAGTRLDFAGQGKVSLVEGNCWDSRVAMVGTRDYWTMLDAFYGALQYGGHINTLWPATLEVPPGAGRLSIYDNGLLTLFWPLGCLWTLESSDGVLYYEYLMSRIWPDYASADGVVTDTIPWTVSSPFGLAWIAREAIAGNGIENFKLVEDVDLAAHDWKSIPGFTGDFDGNSKRILSLHDEPLFASVTNATLHDVTFEYAVVTNAQDATAVGALASTAVGSLVLHDVALDSGRVVGRGGSAAGLVGLVEDYTAVTIADNVNRASVAGGVFNSGIANLGGFTAGGPVATVAITGNGNSGTLPTAKATHAAGGNTSEIVGGTKPDALFASATASGNMGVLDPTNGIPRVNFANALRRGNGLEFRSYIEADDSSVPVIDPYLHIARMTAAFFSDGATNEAGRIIDLVTASESGATVSLARDAQTWLPIVVDRDLTIDLGGRIIENVYDETSVFEVRNGANLKVQNGSIYAYEGQYVSVVSGSFVESGLVKTPWTGQYWNRTPVIHMEAPTGLTSLMSFTVDRAYSALEYSLQSVGSLGESWDKPTDEWVSVKHDGDPLEFRVVPSGAARFYRVKAREKQ